MPAPPTPSAEDRPASDATAVDTNGRFFVGREQEMRALQRGLGDAVSGRGRLVLLGGEPGIGKTRLADEFAATAKGQGALVLWGRCWEAGGAPAYWPWIQSVRGLVYDLDAEALAAAVGGGGPDLVQILPELRERLPDLPERPPASPEAARFRLFEALSGFLRRASAARPLVLVLEDLHAADASSLLLLRFVAGDINASRLLLLGTYRDVEVGRDHPLAGVVPELVRSTGTMRITLPGLRDPHVARFIEEIAGRRAPADLVAAIRRETEGNPLFVEEVVRLLTAEGRLWSHVDDRRWPIPEGVREVIGQRLGRLPEDCRRVLTLAAVMGRDFSVEALQRVTGRTAADLLDALHDAVAARVVAGRQEDPSEFRFAHALIRDTLYDDLMPAERVRLHREVGEALEGLYAGDPEPHLAELAFHFFEAAPGGDAGKAVDYATAAGRRAVALLAAEEAVRLFHMALRHLREPRDEQRRCEVLILLGDAEARSGAQPASKETFLEAAEIATRLDLPDLLGRAAFGYSGRFPWLRAGIDRQVIPLLREALDAIGEQDGVLRALLLARLAGALRDQPSMEPRTSLAREAVAIARRIGEPDTLTYTLLSYWGAALLGPDGIDEQLVIAEELNRLAEQVDDRERLNDAGWVRFIAYMERGQAWEARAQREEMVRHAQELRQPPQQWYAGVVTTVIALQDGRFAEAEQLIDDTWETAGHAQPWDAGAARLFALFVLRREQGRLAELEEDLRRAPAQYPGYRCLPCMLLAALCDLGRLDEARAIFDELTADDLAGFPKDNEWLCALTLLAEAAAVLEDRDRAEVLYEQLSPYGELVALMASEASLGPVHRPLGILAAVLSRDDDAARHFEDAVDQAQRMGARPWVAHAQYGYAELLARRAHPGDRDLAADLAAGTAAACEDMGMTALGMRAGELAARLGVRPRRRPGQPAAASTEAPKGTTLTPRERQVAALVAEGLSNRQIAERLYLSERTAETHVQNILAKLGFTSRTQVAGWAVREGLYADGT